MNLAELGAVVTILASGVVGGITAHTDHAGWLSILFAVLGLGVGLTVALAFMKLAYITLFAAKTGFRGAVLFAVYSFLPVVSITAGLTATYCLTGAILHQFH